MSKKSLINAAAYIGNRIGMLEQAWKISDKSGISWQETLEAAKTFVPVAVDMVELGHETAMQQPEDVNRAVYYEFGDDWGRFMRENGRLPNDEEAHAILVNVVFNAYAGFMTEVQKDHFRVKLQAMREEDDDE